ncbi:MAG: hypothetical protein R3B90_13325 [Planctomycetaceae bacterium]
MDAARKSAAALTQAIAADPRMTNAYVKRAELFAAANLRAQAIQDLESGAAD